jgi:hypothetical protein
MFTTKMEHLLGVLQVQTYVINGELVAFFDKRAISRKGKPRAIRCKECGMGLQDADAASAHSDARYEDE